MESSKGSRLTRKELHHFEGGIARFVDSNIVLLLFHSANTWFADSELAIFDRQKLLQGTDVELWSPSVNIEIVG